MARAYICLARNDLSENLLQGTLDLLPNTSLRNFPVTTPGQTGYLTQFVQDDAIVLADLGAGVFAPTTTVFGLSAYLMDVVDDDAGGTLALTFALASATAALILARVAAGTSLDLAAINAAIVTGTGGANDLNTIGGSFGTVEDILRIVAGESYRIVADTPISGVANAFLTAADGVFTTSPNQIRAFTTGPGGKPFQATPAVPVGDIDQSEVTPARNLGAGVVLATPEGADLNHRDLRQIIDTPTLHNSVLQGRLSKLVDAGFTFLNPSFSYGAGGTATTPDGVALPATGAARAVTIYKADGTVI